MLFTTPVLSDVGIAMVMVPEVPTMWGKSAELITPFTTDVLKRSNPCRPAPSRAPPPRPRPPPRPHPPPSIPTTVTLSWPASSDPTL